jgi:hypothetical protein
LGDHAAIQFRKEDKVRKNRYTKISIIQPVDSETNKKLQELKLKGKRIKEASDYYYDNQRLAERSIQEEIAKITRKVANLPEDASVATTIPDNEGFILVKYTLDIEKGVLKVDPVDPSDDYEDANESY